jgi:hypothetical protein
MDMDRKKLREQYRNRKKRMGCYALVFAPTGEQFIGSSSDLDSIANSIMFRLSVGALGQNPRLQELYVRYGADAFSFRVLEELEADENGTKEDYRDELKILRQMLLETNGQARELLP